MSPLQPLANHLWQSTLFLLTVWLVTLLLRNNRAAVRHRLWLAASMKFLVPFSLLISLGSQVRWSKAPVAVQPQVSILMEEFSQPFAAAVSDPQPVSAPRAPNSFKPSLLLVLSGIWLCGFAANAIAWGRRWRRVRAALRAASPLPLNLPIPVMSGPARLEPGVFGIRKPVLLLPKGIADRLTPGQFQAILAHELCHVKRRDNLAAAIHMIVEALFWFHPLVWWIQTRLVEERERACDEEVLRMAADPQDYAEGILNVCKFYLESPLVCVSGVTGSNLKRRVEAIMLNRAAYKLNFGRQVLLAFAGTLAVAVPVVVGIMNPRAQAQPPIVDRSVPAAAPQMIAQQTAAAPAAEKARPAQPPPATDWQTAAGGKMSFEVASVKRGTFVLPSFPLDVGDAFTSTGGRFIANFPLAAYITFAYKLSPAPDQRQAMFAHLPGWVNTDRFTIEAKAEGNNPTKDQFRLMMQSLVAERFKVAVHFETQQGSVLAFRLVKPGKLGPKLRPHDEGPPCDATSTAGGGDVWPPLCGSYGLRSVPDRGHVQTGSRNVTMAYLAKTLAGTGVAALPVVDQTGLTGTYDFTLEYSPEATDALAIINANNPNGFQIDPQGPTFLDALRDQLGLKLEPAKAPVQDLVIDHVELPSEN